MWLLDYIKWHAKKKRPQRRPVVVANGGLWLVNTHWPSSIKLPSMRFHLTILLCLVLSTCLQGFVLKANPVRFGALSAKAKAAAAAPPPPAAKKVSAAIQHSLHYSIYWLIIYDLFHNRQLLAKQTLSRNSGRSWSSRNWRWRRKKWKLC